MLLRLLILMQKGWSEAGGAQLPDSDLSLNFDFDVAYFVKIFEAIEENLQLLSLFRL